MNADKRRSDQAAKHGFHFHPCSSVFICGLYFLLSCQSYTIAATSQPASDRKAEYVRSVTRGAGLLPWQTKGITDDERQFRSQIEQRKDQMLKSRVAVSHPVTINRESLERARINIKSAAWAKKWADKIREIADYVTDQPDDYVERMIPELTPTNTYGFTCPNCVGSRSQEGAGMRISQWDFRKPDVFSCEQCGQVYPNEKYPETARLECPRSGQTFTYYLSPQEQAASEDRSGKLAWHWVGRPIHVSFSGNIRAAKVTFMIQAACATARQYALSENPRYAARTIAILDRLAHCYRNWLYHDYWDTIADCDPMYAAWHYKKFPLEFKRHLSEDAYALDTEKSAAMLRDFWGAGRIHASTDSVSSLVELAEAYDLVHDAADKSGKSLWKPETRERVERDLLLEYIIGAEPFVGGAGKADNISNKSPRVYTAMAAVGRCLGLCQYVKTALRGYEGVRDQSFLCDGFSRESPAYTDMYLSELMQVPEQLDGFRWPTNYPGRSGTIDLFATDSRLRLMFRAMIDQLRPDGRYPPLSDTVQTARPSAHLVEMGLKHYPEYFTGILPAMMPSPTQYALFNLDDEAVRQDTGLKLPEIYFPAWMTAFLRHGQGPSAAFASLSFSPSGGHRHLDNLALFYTDGGRTVLGDHGYVGDMPVNLWNKSTFSHNLVIVDNAEQNSKRHPRFVRMLTSPRVSVIEAASDAYRQCSEYSRLVAMVKGPVGQTLAIDVFRVKGGKRHDYRVFSELASSDTPESRMTFHGLRMPAEPPLPQVGTSLAKDDIFGLRDARGVDRPPASFEAAWMQKDCSYRLWMRTQADRVEASNGPGQETIDQAGRRVRYLDVIRQGDSLESTFVAVHEPSGGGDKPIVSSVDRLDVATQAGPNALALSISTSWGRYVLLNRFDGLASTSLPFGDVRFQGDLAVLHEDVGKLWAITQGAVTLIHKDKGFENATPAWAGKVAKCTADTLETKTRRPTDWQVVPSDVQQYVRIKTKEYETGFIVRSTTENTVRIDRFPLPDTSEFNLPAVRIVDGQGEAVNGPNKVHNR